MHHHHGRIQLDLRIPAGHGRDTALVQCQNTVDVRMGIQGVEKMCFPGARVIKDVLHSTSRQLFNQNLRWIAGDWSHLHGVSPLPCWAVLQAATRISCLLVSDCSTTTVDGVDDCKGNPGYARARRVVCSVAWQ